MLFAIGRELYAAMSAGQGKSSAGADPGPAGAVHASALCARRAAHAVAQYPDFAAHKAEHDALAKQVLAFQTEFKAGRATMAVQVLQFLKDWLERPY